MATVCAMTTKRIHGYPEMVAIGTAASLLGVSVSTVRRWDAAGLITSTRTLGGQRRYRVADLLAIRDGQAA